MTSSWQKPGLPQFSRDSKLLRQAEEEFLFGSGVIVGAVQHLYAGDRDQLTVEAITTEALTTSEIEGETLDRASVQWSLRMALGLSAGRRSVRPAEAGVAEMMTDLYRSYAMPLSDDTLFAWLPSNSPPAPFFLQ